MNSVNLIGRLGNDPQIRTTNGGQQVASLTLAVPRGKDQTNWVRCVLWDKLAKLAENLQKGSRIAVSGELQVRQYENEGVRKEVVEVNVRALDFLDPKNGNSKEYHQADFADKEIPFN